MMVAALKAPPTLESLRALQTGAFMLIIDAYDRKATRDAMLTAVSAAGTLLTELGKLFMIEQVRAAADIAEGVPLTAIEVARQELLKHIQRATKDALSMAALLKQCPNDEDKVN
jgi:hypothetical protein